MKYLFTPLFTFIFLVSFAQSPNLEINEIANGFNSPVDIANAGDSRLFIVEQGGRIMILNEDMSINPVPFLDIDNLTNGQGEQGLLGLAFHPNYSQNGYFYINYTTNLGDTRIARYSVSSTNPDMADPSSGLILIGQPQPYSNHNAGDLNFGPDGYLYIPLGDGGAGGDPENRAQNTQTKLGKMLRIDVDNGSPYAIPADNPFVDDDSALDEIWAIGLRNTWRFSFDAANGNMWIADVGQSEWEEINVELAGSAGGENYGWRCKEGLADYNTSMCSSELELHDPIIVYSHANGACSITGGYVYRGSDYPSMDGLYFFTDYCNGQFRYVMLNDIGEWEVVPFLGPQGFGWSTFGVDADGELYVANLDGTIFRIEDACASLEVGIVAEGGLLTATAIGDSYVWWLDGQVISGANEQTYLATQGGSYTVMVTVDGCTVESLPFVLTGIEELKKNKLGISPNPVDASLHFSVDPSLDIRWIAIYDVNGREVYREKYSPFSEINVSDLKNGVYMLELSNDRLGIQENFIVQH